MQRMSTPGNKTPAMTSADALDEHVRRHINGYQRRHVRACELNLVEVRAPSIKHGLRGKSGLPTGMTCLRRPPMVPSRYCHVEERAGVSRETANQQVIATTFNNYPETMRGRREEALPAHPLSFEPIIKTSCRPLSVDVRQARRTTGVRFMLRHEGLSLMLAAVTRLVVECFNCYLLLPPVQEACCEKSGLLPMDCGPGDLHRGVVLPSDHLRASH